jgi:hypothetical protein
MLSPGSPPQIAPFCAALCARGATVLGVGDLAADLLPAALRADLAEYLPVASMWDYDALRDGVAGLVARHGPLHRIDSLMEHWMTHEAMLRADFGVAGLTLAQTERRRSKAAMAEIYREAGIDCPPVRRVDGPDDLRRAVEAFGLPLVLKPATGSGAVATFAVRDAAGLAAALARSLDGYVAQPFVEGDIVTFDGLTNADGEVVYFTSHAYDAGIMEVLTGRLDGHYYSLREVPAALEALGRRAVAAFDVRERFFHQEFFRRPDGSLVALEMNLRPPAGFTPDLMSAAGDLDVHAIWAGVVTGERWRGLRHERRYHTAHAGRRRDRTYRVPHDELLDRLGDALVAFRPMPWAYADTMGDDAYLLRHPDLGALREAIALVQAPAT